MKKFKVSIRVKEVGPGDESLETSATVLASDVIAAVRPFRDTAAKMAPREDEPTDDD